jgi:DNA polymerase I
MANNILLLLDGTALAYRSYFAFINSNLRNADGLPTGAIYGFANALVRLIDSHKPTHFAVAWDTHAPTFRHEMDVEYKAHRPPQPEELRESIPYIKQMLGLFNIQSLERDGIEADDIVGSLAESARGKEVQVFMVTPDKDYMQLVHDNIFMMKPLNNGDGFEIIDRAGVEAFFGVPPEQVIDVLTIIGDSSDNIPGISGVGKKTAPELIKEYGNIENLIAAAPNAKSKRVREGIIGNEARIRLSRELVVIKTDCEDFTNWETLKWDGPDRQALGAFFNRMQFRTLTKKFSGSGFQITEPTDAAQADLFGSAVSVGSPEIDSDYRKINSDEVNYTCIRSIDELYSFLEKVTDHDHLSIDTETTGVDPMTASLLGVALSYSKASGVYIPVGDGFLSVPEVIDALNPLLNRSDLTLVAHNFKYDYMVLKRHGAEINAPIFDTMLAAYLVDPAQPLKMDALSMKYLGYEPVPIEALIGSGKKQRSMAEVSLEDVTIYAVEDADITLQLYHTLSKHIEADDLSNVAFNIEFPLSCVLGDMEIAGIALDTDMLANFSEIIAAEILEIEKEIYQKAGTEFNINSPQQLGEILFKKMKLPSGKKTATGQYSTSEAVLSELAVRYELPAKILEYRSLAKLRSTYIDALPPLIHPETGRIHTNYNQSVAATGRLSSSNPNLQNIPIRTARGREIRKAFVPAPGFKLLSVDYSQIELRVIASMSGDLAMQEAFKSDEDIHSRTAREIFDLDPTYEVDREQRRKAKEVNFGIPYGVSAFGLAQRLGIGNNEARDIIDAYFNRFPGVKKYIDETKAFAHENGYVKTLSGRRRYIPDIRSSNFNIRSFAERTAINMPIQGTAADLIKIAMIQVAQTFKKEQLKSRMLLQVHDELVLEVHESELDVVPNMVKSVMESAMSLDVPLKVEMGIADNWLDAH